jgi:eukaryotic-like serine/threonine-protein kinase
MVTMNSADTIDDGQLYCPTCEQTFATGETCPDDATRLVNLATRDTMIGQTLDGRYTLVGKLGSGGMGAVYRATQHSVGRDVAVKVIAANLTSDPVAIKRFLREAKLASRLSQPNAVGVLDFGQTPDDVFYLVMELVEGRTLETVLESDPVLPAARTIRIGMQICDALEGAHALQIVHRDLKPANIMLLTTGRDLVKVLDFGIARSLAVDGTKMTQTGSTLGTPGFMPPEVALGESFDARADLYSLGCILYLMSTGRLPFAASSVQEMLSMHITQPPMPMYGVPGELSAVVMRLLEKQPDQRFPTAAATREALEAAMYALHAKPSSEVISGDTPTAIHAVKSPGYSTIPTGVVVGYSAPPPDLTPEPVRKRSRLPIVGAIATLAVGSVVGYLLLRPTDDHHVAPPVDAAAPRLAQPAPVVDAAPPPDFAASVIAAPTPPVDAAPVKTAPSHHHSAAVHVDAGPDDNMAQPF